MFSFWQEVHYIYKVKYVTKSGVPYTFAFCIICHFPYDASFSFLRKPTAETEKLSNTLNRCESHCDQRHLSCLQFSKYAMSCNSCFRIRILPADDHLVGAVGEAGEARGSHWVPRGAGNVMNPVSETRLFISAVNAAFVFPVCALGQRMTSTTQKWFF